MSIRRGLRAICLVAPAVLLALIGTAGTSQANQVTGAGFTTVNENVDGTGHCKNGNPNVNCNIYDGKEFVWLNGGPSTAYVGDGTYFFAVLDPGGQADPNDGTAKNLSSPNDAYTNRTFSVNGGTVSYSGTHDFDSNKIRLMPYNDTSNPGGVYIMAICSLGPNGTDYPVTPSDCKYDAFKVQEGQVTPAGGLTVTKDASGVDTRTFTWTIQKTVDPKGTVDSSGPVTFNYTVVVTKDGGAVSGVNVSGTITVTNPNLDSNNNTVGVDITGVTDQLSNNTVCTVTNGGSQTLSQFNTNFAYSCDLSSLPTGELDNTATVSWGAQFLDNGDFLDAGSADFTFTEISFNETKVDDCVTVNDTVAGNLGTTCDSKTYTYSSTIGTPGTCVTQNNTATFTTDTTGTTGSASQTVTACVGADLVVSKNATPSFTRTYNWTIQKSVDKTFFDPGGTAHYTVTVTETGFTDSGWQVAGTIHVANPNDWEAITANVTDAVGNGGSCSVTGGTGVSIPASGSVDLPYSCTWSSAPSSSSGTNTATAAWDSSAAFTPDASAAGSAGFAFTTPTSTVHKTITVSDTFGGTLGTATATDTTPFTVKSFNYTRFFTPPSSCQNITNTATIVETGQTSSVTVRVCNSGALTMGFWQNKNGQGIISAANQTSLGNWLRAYHPFSDAPTTGIATYVSNIIKVAQCTSTTNTCNSMLRAQMLATALDVYFSDPALGGNRINAPAPIGGLTIDLTHVCAMIDGSGGSATCSGTYQNASSAFGGATSMTVQAMLNYQNTSDPLADAGAVWYGQVKATQVLAKNAFDAINNQVATSP